MCACWEKHSLQRQITTPCLAACSQAKSPVPPVPRATLQLTSLRLDFELT